MGAIIPKSVANFPISALLEKHGCGLFKKPGKVSELREIPEHPDLLIMVNLPRKSIFEFNLQGVFNKTEEVITAMTVLIQDKVLKEKGIPTDLVAYGKNIDKYLPSELRNNVKLQKCALVIKKLEKLDKELIIRYEHAGSADKSLKETSTVFGYPVRLNIKVGESYDESLFTPSSKAEKGHDVYLMRNEIASQIDARHINRAWEIANTIHDYFEERGTDIGDLKLELSKIINGVIYMLDKFGPDEARFWDHIERLQAVSEGREPQSMDKDKLRKWGKAIVTPFHEGGKQIIGINNLDPENPEHVAFVHSLKVPSEVNSATCMAYLEIFLRGNNGNPLEHFQENVMGIAV